jgi:hypothetical protein
MECLLASLDDCVSLDRYLAIIEEILSDPNQLSPREAADRVTASMYVALVIRNPLHDDFPAWEERGLRLATTTSDMGVKTHITGSRGHLSRLHGKV